MIHRFLCVADPNQASAPEAFGALPAAGMRAAMPTCDSSKAAEAAGKKSVINELRAEVLPKQETETVQRSQCEDRKVAMAGEVVNDATGLGHADVGISTGTGTDVALESVGVTLGYGDLRGIARASRLSYATM